MNKERKERADEKFRKVLATARAKIRQWRFAACRILNRRAWSASTTVEPLRPPLGPLVWILVRPQSVFCKHSHVAFVISSRRLPNCSPIGVADRLQALYQPRIPPLERVHLHSLFAPSTNCHRLKALQPDQDRPLRPRLNLWTPCRTLLRDWTP